MQLNHLRALAIRDGALVMLTLGLWAATVKIGPAESLGPVALHVLTGLMTPLVGYLLHEWGHLVGAWMRRSVVHLPESPFASAFLFRFDTGLNSREQFLAMSLGGFVASAIVVAFLLVSLPLSLLASWIALALTVLGVLATFILEIPPALKVYRGGAMPEGVAFVVSDQR